MTVKAVILLNRRAKMAKRQNTNNQLPSNDLADLNDNTIIIDEFMNSQNDFTSDRFGRQFKTRHKIISDLNKLTKNNIGDFRLMPFRANELPFGWYFRNGDNYLLYSPQGQVLNQLSGNYKRDHQITIKNINGQQYINVPSAFAPDGRGFFERPANGTTRQIGSWEDDAIRNIKGGLPSGNFKALLGHAKIETGDKNGAISILSAGDDYLASSASSTNPRQLRYMFFDFDASRVVPTAHENRPINIGMTPVIFLGV